MNIKEFLDRFGRSTTSNFELMDMAKQLGIKPFYYCMKDEIKKLKRIKKYPIYCIANYHNSNQQGIHHVAIFRDKDKSYYFDSYGIKPLKEVKDFLKNGIYSTFQIQSYDQRFCGQICMWILFQLSIGKDFFQTVLDLNEYFNIKNEWISTC